MSRSRVMLSLILAALSYGTALAAPALETPAEVAVEAYPLALDGYCAVTLAAERTWKQGDARYGAIHRRRTFLFATQAEQEKFLADPDRYCPVLTGCDPVIYLRTGKLVDGSPKFSLTFRKQVYLFADEASLQAFQKDAHQLTEGLKQAMNGELKDAKR